MKIRIATREETLYILSFAQEVMKEATKGKVKPFEEIAQQVMLPILREGGYYLIYIEKGIIYGWIGVGVTHDLYSNEMIGMIPELYVFPRYRRIGVAEQLCQTACRQLKTDGYKRVQLNVFSGNQAKKLYKKIGFNEVSTLMERKL